MLKTDPFAVLNVLGVPDGVLSTSTQGQLGQKLAIAASSALKTAMRMSGMTAEELDKAMPELGTAVVYIFIVFTLLLDEAAARLARELAGVLENAILHASVDDKGADNTLATAKAMAEGAKLLVQDVMKIKDAPTDNAPRDALLVRYDSHNIGFGSNFINLGGHGYVATCRVVFARNWRKQAH